MIFVNIRLSLSNFKNVNYKILTHLSKGLSVRIVLLKQLEYGAEEIAQWPRAFIAFLGDQSSGSSIHIGRLKSTGSSSSR